MAAVFYAAAVPVGVGWRRWMVAAMAGLWSMRLALYLVARVRKPGEDGPTGICVRNGVVPRR